MVEGDQVKSGGGGGGEKRMGLSKKGKVTQNEWAFLGERRDPVEQSHRGMTVDVGGGGGGGQWIVTKE